MPEAFSKTNAWAHLNKQCDFGPRVPNSEGHLKCRDYLVAELKKTCDEVSLQPFTHTWSQGGVTKKMFNIIGTQNWEKGSPKVLLLAHWDTRPSAEYDPDPRKVHLPIMGANDGASGVAVLLEAARVLKARNPGLGIMYLLTDGEDLGPELDEMFLGAVHFAKNLPKPKPEYGILLDMVGDKNLVIPMEPNSKRLAPKVLNAFFKHAHKIGLGQTFPMREGPEIVDDHLPINDAGIPTIDLIDFDYLPWHTTSDTVDKCSPDSLEKVGRALVEFIDQSPPFRP